LLSAAEDAVQEGDGEEAVRLATEAHASFKGANIKAAALDAFLVLCRAYRAREEPKRAAEEAQAEAARLKAAGDKQGEASVMVALAEVEQAEHRHEEALKILADALDIARSSSEAKIEAVALMACVTSHMRRDFLEEALRDAQAALALYDRVQDRVGQCKAHIMVATVQLEDHALEDGLAAATEAVKFARSAGLAKYEVSSLCLLARLQLLKERPRQAGQVAEEALTLCRKEGLSKDEGSVVDVLVDALVQRGDLKKAAQVAAAGVVAFQASGHKRAEAAARRAMSLVLAARHDWAAAVEQRTMEIELLKAVGDRRVQAASLLALSQIHASGESADDALKAAQDAATISKELADRRAEGLALYAQVFPLVLNQQLDDALEKVSAARELFQEIADRRNDARALWAAASVYARQDDFGSAISRAMEACTIMEETSDKRGAANGLLVLSEMQQAGAENERAMQTAREAYERCLQLGCKRGQAAALQRQAQVELANDMPDSAARLFLQARDLFRRKEDRTNEATLLNLLARVNIDKGAKEADELASKGGSASVAARKSRMSIRRSGREASKQARQAIGLSTLREDKYEEGVSLIFLAQARMLHGRLGDTLKAAEKAELIFKETGDKVMLARIKVIIAQVHFFDDKKQEKAEELANKALEMARLADDYQAEDGAIRILEAIVAKQQAAMPAVQEVYYEAFPAGKQEAAVSAAAEVAKVGLDPEMVRPKVLDVVKNVTGSDEEAIQLDTPLMDTGMDSLSAVAFRNELNRMFAGTNLPASLMFDYPNINHITNHIVEQSLA